MRAACCAAGFTLILSVLLSLQTSVAAPATPFVSATSATGPAAFGPAPASVAAFQQQDDQYVGNEMCLRCHASHEESLADSPHEDYVAISDRGCQECHGAGRAHVQDPEDTRLQPRFSSRTVGQRRAACLECHTDDGHDSEHFQAGQACSSCHLIHDFEAGVTGAAGVAVCVDCHQGVTAPAAPALPAGTSAQADFQYWATPHSEEACAACHTLGNLADEPWEDRAGTERCLECHAQTHPRFFASSHSLAGLSCKSCHSVHADDLVDAFASADYVGRTSQQCAACHATAVTEFTFNERHRLEEGIMECTSCHNPHEPTPRVRLGGFKTHQCTQCHVDKLGPFVFEHGTSMVEGCTSCHQPHGSPNRFMLVIQEEGALCYSCHVDMPGFHSRYSSETMCTSCHVSIHGSNLHPAFLQ